MIYLASASPRRQQLIGLFGRDFSVVPAHCDESIDVCEPSARCVQLAVRKAQAARAGLTLQPEDVLIAADTIVFLAPDVLEKPRDAADARRMLRALSGQTHTVYTGVCVYHNAQSYSFFAHSDVHFYPLTDRQIDDYVASGAPMDKAGSYGIQDAGALFVRGIVGDFYNVMGLPIAQLHQLLLQIGAL